MAKLTIAQGETEHTIDLSEDRKISIGRHSANDIVLKDVKSSRNHAQIVFVKNGFVLQDLNSTNGVIVNGEKNTKRRLEHGDEILIGDTTMVYKDNEEIDRVIDEVVALKLSTTKSSGIVGAERVGLTSKVDITRKRMHSVLMYAKQPDADMSKVVDALTKMTRMMDNIASDVTTFDKSYQILYTLYKIGRAVNQVFELKDLLNLILDMIIRLMNAERGFIMLLDSNTGQLIPTVTRRMGATIDGEDSVKISNSIANKVALEGKPILTTDAQMDPRFKEGQSILSYNIRSVMCVPLTSKDTIMGVLYIDNRQASGCFSAEDLDFLQGFATNSAIAIERTKMYDELEDSYLASIQVLANVLDSHDPYTHGHSERVMSYSVMIAREMNLSEKQVKNIKYAALLHDIGKVGISKAIINKEGGLTDEEFLQIKSHPDAGYKIVKPIKFLHEKLAALRHHHEKYDGTGYPEGLKGDDIPLDARIIAVADTFDAITSTRSYRKAKTKEYAVNEIQKNSGIQFDPRVVEAFLRLIKNSEIDVP